jgi:hypothetical protein
MIAICSNKRMFMRRHSLAWVLVAGAACGLTGLSACGGGDSADDSSAGSGGVVDSGGTASGGVGTGGDLALGGSATLGGGGSVGGANAGTSAGGIANGVGGKGGAASGGAPVGPANGGAADVAGASNAGAPGVVDCGGACVGNRPVCDPETAMCVECLADIDCKNPSKPGCLLSTHRCEDCSKNAQCPADKPMCDVQKGQCQ